MSAEMPGLPGSNPAVDAAFVPSRGWHFPGSPRVHRTRCGWVLALERTKKHGDGLFLSRREPSFTSRNMWVCQ